MGINMRKNRNNDAFIVSEKSKAIFGDDLILGNSADEDLSVDSILSEFSSKPAVNEKPDNEAIKPSAVIPELSDKDTAEEKAVVTE